MLSVPAGIDASLTPVLSELQPISGTGLNISSRQMSSQPNGNTPIPVGSDGSTPKQHRASVPRKASSRPPTYHSASTPLPSTSQSHSRSDVSVIDEHDSTGRLTEEEMQSSLLAQIHDWLHQEKTRRRARRRKSTLTVRSTDGAGDEDGAGGGPLERTSSQTSEGTFALEKLERILSLYSANMPSFGPKRTVHRRRTGKGLRSSSVSESEYPDLEGAVPTVDALLDNSKTLSYAGGAAGDDSDDNSSSSARRASEKKHWLNFKSEIARIVHTLRLKGWRKVPLDRAGDIDVTRLSGALTNAVYVVAPPKNLALPPVKAEDGSDRLIPRRRPPKLLLRIYGPQVDHLIDREIELQILRRLGRKNIGPKVLGTFNNGRFEEYFEARPLTPRELRSPDTSKQIAKRMRELHEGIDLLDDEREGGPAVFKNWDKWVDRCEQVTGWLDKEILSAANDPKTPSETWRRRGFVCGVQWPLFRKAVENYRKWLVATCGGLTEIKRQLVFAHNDTQYGNLLRLEPSSESPLLLPANEHKQLVVIDFEYASANTPAFEFANHFSEWCYNYHDPEKPWACNVKNYPRPDEQYRFVTAYLRHKPGVSSRSPSSPFATPSMRGSSIGTPYMTPLDLDAGPNPQFPSLNDLEQKSTEDPLETDAHFLLWQTRLWRVINSAQWVAWGIVQAKATGMQEGTTAVANANAGAVQNARQSASVETSSDPEPSNKPSEEGEAERKASEGNRPPVDPDIDEVDEFDYLAYSQDRAMFFWADLLALNLIKEDELPREMVEHVKSRMIDY